MIVIGAGRLTLGDNVSLVLPDARDGSIYAGLNLGHFGTKLRRSDDGGATWIECAVPEYPMQLKLWQIGFADLLILNKVDLVVREQIDRIKTWLDEHFHRDRLIESQCAAQDCACLWPLRCDAVGPRLAHSRSTLVRRPALPRTSPRPDSMAISEWHYLQVDDEIMEAATRSDCWQTSSQPPTSTDSATTYAPSKRAAEIAAVGVRKSSQVQETRRKSVGADDGAVIVRNEETPCKQGVS